MRLAFRENKNKKKNGDGRGRASFPLHFLTIGNLQLTANKHSRFGAVTVRERFFYFFITAL